ncbi:MAG: hypothetical protein ABFS14_06300 [Gemmatimonadota bacterium]
MRIPTQDWCVVLVALALVGCRGESDPSGETVPDAPGGQDLALVTPAHYRASLTFVGTGSRALLMHAALDNRTSAGETRLAYRGWLRGAEGWTLVLNESSSLPIPRAAWRVLPTPSMRVIIGPAGDVTGLNIQDGERNIRLRSSGILASWAGATGQPESLAIATLSDGTVSQAGFLLARRGARSNQSPMPSSRPQQFLLADTLGNAFLLMRSHVDPGSPATAWTVIDGVENEWPDLVIENADPSRVVSDRWRITLPEAGITGELSGIVPFVDDLARRDSGVRAYRVVGTLVVAGMRRPIVGVGTEERGP